MQRASVSRRTDTNHPMSPGLRARSSERHVDLLPVEEDPHTCTTIEHFTNSNNHNNHNITRNMEKPSNSDLHRSMSDPFDTAHHDNAFGGGTVVGTAASDNDDDEDIYVLAASTSQMSMHNANNNNNSNNSNAATTTTNSSSNNHNHYIIIPTFARYPCIAHKNKNCWSEPPITIFHVRGINYCSDQKKIPSLPYLLRARGSDIFLTDPKHQSFSLDSMYVFLVHFLFVVIVVLAVVVSHTIHK